MPIAALIAEALVGALAMAMASLIGRALLALGISYITFTGMDVLLSGLNDSINSNLGSLPGELISWLGILQVQTSISILASALAIRMSFKAIGGAMKKMVRK
jgi:hypothetical protein